MVRQWIAASLLTVLGILFLLHHAIPRLEDGAEDIRHAHQAMQDESVILGKTWEMVDRGDLRHGIEVYPGFYPYQVALIRWLTRGAEARTTILATRWWSLVVMVLALLVTTLAFGAGTGSPIAGALVSVAIALSPQMIEWTSRVHPDAWLLLLDHGALGCFALGVDRKNHRWLLAATVLAAFSAGTKLVGCFIMVPIGLWILFDRQRSLADRLRTLALHAAVFAGIFILTNPVLLTDGVHLLRGFATQHRRNRKGSGGVEGWLEVLSGPEGWGYSGLLLFGIGLFLFARRPDRRAAPILAFGLFYLCFVVFGVKLNEPRYAYPAVWPLLAVALAQIRPGRLGRASALAIGLLVVGVYLATDHPRQQQARAAIAEKYQRALTPERREIGRKLLDLNLGPDRVVYSSAAAFVPEPLRWKVIWSLAEIDATAPVGALVIDDDLRAAGLSELPALTRSFKLVVTATVGSTRVMVPRPF